MQDIASIKPPVFFLKRFRNSEKKVTLKQILSLKNPLKTKGKNDKPKSLENFERFSKKSCNKIKEKLIGERPKQK